MKELGADDFMPLVEVEKIVDGSISKVVKTKPQSKNKKPQKRSGIVNKRQKRLEKGQTRSKNGRERSTSHNVIFFRQTKKRSAAT